MPSLDGGTAADAAIARWAMDPGCDPVISWSKNVFAPVPLRFGTMKSR